MKLFAEWKATGSCRACGDRRSHFAVLISMFLVLMFAVSCGDDDSTTPTNTRTEVIELSETTVDFTIDAGDADPTLQTVSVTNTGPGTLDGLGASIAYGSGQPTGWLSAVLGGTIAPADLTIQATTGGGTLGAGTYDARVSVASSKANNSPQYVDVTFIIYAKIGLYQEFTGGTNFAPNFLLGNKITVTEASTLTHLCLIARAAGPQAKIGLYTDVSGEPGQLVASTLATAIVDGELEIAVTETSLPAGDYWIMVCYNDYANGGLRTTNPSAPGRYIAHAFGTALPATFPAATNYDGNEFNYYIKAIVP